MRRQTLDTMGAGTLFPPRQTSNHLRIPSFSRAAPPDDIAGLSLGSLTHYPSDTAGARATMVNLPECAREVMGQRAYRLHGNNAQTAADNKSEHARNLVKNITSTPQRLVQNNR